MIVRCETCVRFYDDAERWTICPHRGLGFSPTEGVFVDQKSRHPAIAGVLQFFAFSHLPPHLQEVSKPFCELAEKIADGPANAESAVALRKLLESKDAAVRAVLYKT